MASATTEAGLADPNTAKVPKQAMGLLLAHRAIMEEDLRSTLADSRAKARSWWQNKGTNGISGDGKVDVPPEEDMGTIHIGDINYAPPAKPATQDATAPTAPATPSVGTQPSSGISNLARAAILGAATLGGGGLGAAAMSYLNRPDVPAVQSTVPSAQPVLRIFRSTPANTETPNG